MKRPHAEGAAEGVHVRRRAQYRQQQGRAQQGRVQQGRVQQGRVQQGTDGSLG
jgi:hypothetical protein